MGIGTAPPPLHGGGGGGVHVYTARLTPYVVIVCAIAASGGTLFGYDIGVTGGVTAMPEFLREFFPDTYARQQAAAAGAHDPYCTYNDPVLQLFTSSVFLAGMLSTLVAAEVSRRGRKLTMLLSGLLFLVGIALCTGAVATAMLIVGRLLIGFGIGLANQAVPVYLSELAPPQLRGALNNLFQLATTFGMLAAQVINLGTQRLEPWGWRLSLGIGLVPALVLTIGALVVPETPNSLAERGRLDAARAVLVRLRGTQDVGREMQDIAAAAQQAASSRNAWSQLLRRDTLPELLVGCGIAAFSQANGINAILLFAPVVFKTLGLAQAAALLNAVLIGGTLFACTFVAIALVDRVGRRPLLIEGGLQMLASMVAAGALLGAAGPGVQLSEGSAAGLLVCMCVFVAGFAWSWGPLGWLIPSEIMPLPSRSAGQALYTAVNFGVAFASSQAFLPELCAMKWAVFAFFAFWVLVMTLFAALLVQETRGVPIEQMGALWRQHWLWRRVAGAAGSGGNGGEATADGVGDKEAAGGSVRCTGPSEQPPV